MLRGFREVGDPAHQSRRCALVVAGCHLGVVYQRTVCSRSVCSQTLEALIGKSRGHLRKKSFRRFAKRIVSVQSGANGPATTLPARLSSTFKIRLIQPTEVPRSEACDKLLVYLPGTDGTGQAILPQIPALRSLGYDVWCLTIPPDDRSDWEQLTTQVTLLLRQLLAHWRQGHPAAAAAGAVAGVAAAGTASGAAAGSSAAPPRITILAESFGCCLALRLAATGAGPELLERMVLLNPATSFNRSLSGLSSLIAATNLLSLFPRDWYAVAQTTLLPFLVDGGRVEEANQRLLQSMILMEPPPSNQSFGFGAAKLTAAAAPAGGAAAAAADGAAGALASAGSVAGAAGSSSSSSSSGAAGGAGDGATLYYGPAAAANFRANLLREGDPGEELLGRVATPVLLVTSARDRLLPSILEGARLERALPNARRYILPDAGHAAMLERGFNMEAVMQAARFEPGQVKAATGTATPRRAALRRAPATSPAAAAELQPDTATTPPSAANTSNESSAGAHGAGDDSVGAAPTWRGYDGNGNGAAQAVSVAANFGGLDAAATGTAGDVGERGQAPAPGWVAEARSGTGEVRSADGETSTSRQLQQLGISGEAAAMAAAASGLSSRALGQQRITRSGSSRGGSSSSNSNNSKSKTSVGIRHVGGKDVGSKNEGGGGSGDNEAAVADIDSAFDEWCQNLAPWRDVVSPVVLGFEHLPAPGSPDFARPMLFVGNHQKMGFYDTPLLVYELYVRGYRVRGLAHPGHWAGPMGRWFESFGSVKASPMAAFRLLRSAEKVLLFPGGAREVVKKRGQEYTLLWKDSPDFVRLAARCNALIVPFAAVGADDAYEVIMDTDEVIAHPILGPLTTGLLSRVSSDLAPEESIFPITKLPVVGLPTPIPIPNLQRLYFQFAPPVDPRALGVDINNQQQMQDLYDGIKGTVTQCMSELLAVRDADDESQLGPRLSKTLQRIVPVLGAAASPPSSH